MIQANMRKAIQMRTAENGQLNLSRMRRLPVSSIIAIALAAFALGSAFIYAQQSTGTRKKPAAKKPTAAMQQLAAPQEPAVPKPPDWPVNDHPKEATVVWNSHGLRIDAANSSLQQILKDVATTTGVKISGLNSDQRIFGVYGPGPARDVLSQLLDGSGYNILMIGDRGQGTPRQIVLSRQPTGPAPPSMNNPGTSNDDNSADIEEPEPQPQPEPPPAAPTNGFGPGAQPRTPQQILQEMQQRQRRIEQMQQQPNANPQ